MLEASIEEFVDGILKIISPRYLNFMIDNGWLLIQSAFYAIRHPPTEYYALVEPKEAHKVERVRVMAEKFVLPLAGLTRYVVAKFPYEAVEEKVTPEWLKKRGMAKCPELVEVVEAKGVSGEAWLEEQCREVIMFTTGRIQWSDEEGTMVPVRYVTRR